MSETRVLLLGDGPLYEALARGLRRAGHRVDRAGSAAAGLCQAARTAPAVAVLDAGMTGAGGLCAALKQCCGAVLVAGGGADLQAMRAAFLQGADDYLPGPVNAERLTADIRARLETPTPPPPEPREEVLRFGPLELHLASCRAAIHGRDAQLTPKEYLILHLLVRHPDRRFPAAEIYRRLWRLEGERVDHVIQVHIASIRKKLELYGDSPLQITVKRGAGYRLVSRERPDAHPGEAVVRQLQTAL